MDGPPLDDEADELVVVDARWLKIRHVSAKALARLGYAPGELDGCDISLIGPAYPRELLPPPVGSALGMEEERRIVTEHRTRHGTHYRVEAQIQLRSVSQHLHFVILASSA